jgi:hypothetical protein
MPAAPCRCPSFSITGAGAFGSLPRFAAGMGPICGGGLKYSNLYLRRKPFPTDKKPRKPPVPLTEPLDFFDGGTDDSRKALILGGNLVRALTCNTFV